ncbi:hypothetical protein BHM03_00013036 [Ensete ventricosum]|uniref:Uncharacterized protein n=1 Tax=Ensete ventricosum TaxID=4639 RepID=A0A445MDV9_ENSVE|nr:hypothetical protein BHM03_00013036 [Ensete ventricosum]
MYEVLNLVLQIVALLGVMSVVTMEAVVASAIPFLDSNPHRVEDFDESFLPDLEENLSMGRVERNIREPGNNLLDSLRPLPWEPRRWAPRGLSPRALLIFMLLRHLSLDDDILVGPLQHFRHDRRGLLHEYRCWAPSRITRRGLVRLRGDRGRSSTGWVAGGYPSSDNVVLAWGREATLLVIALSLPGAGRLPGAVSLAAG